MHQPKWPFSRASQARSQEIESLLAAAPQRTMASFYRTAAGAEIDLVLEMPGKRGLWAIEIKRSLSPGFAGIPNPLFAAPNTMMLFGDGKKAIVEITKALQEG